MKTVNIIGCDQSLTKSVMHCGNITKRWGNWNTAMHMAARLADWESHCYAAAIDCTSNKPMAVRDIAYIEGYSFGGGGKKKGKDGQSAFSGMRKETAGEVGGLLRVILYTRGIDIIVVSPGTLKKFICGKGNAPKDGVRMDLLETFRMASRDNNDADARVLEIIGHCHQGFESYNGIKFTKFHKDCVKVLGVWEAGA